MTRVKTTERHASSYLDGMCIFYKALLLRPTCGLNIVSLRRFKFHRIVIIKCSHTFYLHIAVLHAWKEYGHISVLRAQYSLDEVNSPCFRNKSLRNNDFYNSLESSHFSGHVMEALLLITNLSERGQRSPFTKFSSVRNPKSLWQRAQVLSR